MLVAHKTSRALVYGIGTQFYILIFRQHTMINNPIERQSNLPPPNVGRGKLIIICCIYNKLEHQHLMKDHLHLQNLDALYCL